MNMAQLDIETRKRPAAHELLTPSAREAEQHRERKYVCI